MKWLYQQYCFFNDIFIKARGLWVSGIRKDSPFSCPPFSYLHNSHTSTIPLRLPSHCIQQEGRGSSVGGRGSSVGGRGSSVGGRVVQYGDVVVQ